MLRWQHTYRRGVLHGPARGYHQSCLRAYAGRFERGKRSGRWVIFHPTGLKQAEGDYRAGKRVGTWSFYHKDGPLVRKGPFVDDEAHGRFTEWFTNGQKWQTSRFRPGRAAG